MRWWGWMLAVLGGWAAGAAAAVAVLAAGPDRWP